MERITTKEQAEAFIEEQVSAIREQVGDGKVLLALSGGVDSSVCAALLIRAIGDQLVCVHVNHGLLRKGEPEQVIQVFRNELGANLIYVDAVDRFLDKLEGVDDPEEKRHIIGAEFIDVFAEEAAKLDGIEYLGQGTIYPDILESKDGIKAHHNVGGMPEEFDFELVEPVKLLYKDEVRVVGTALGLPVSLSRAPAWECAVRGRSLATGLKLCVNPMPSCARSLQRPGWRGRSGSILRSCLISNRPVLQTERELLTGHASSVRSIRPMSWK